MVSELKTFLNRKNVTTLLVLLLMVVILPVGIALIRQNQIFYSKAAGERIQLGTGRCVEDRNGTKVLTCTEIPLNLAAPFDPKASPPGSPGASPSPGQESGLLNGIIMALELGDQITQPIDEAQVTVTVSGTTVVTGTGGGKARDFTATGSAVTVSNANLPSNDFTIAALINPKSFGVGNIGSIINRRNAQNLGGFTLEPNGQLGQGEINCYISKEAGQTAEYNLASSAPAKLTANTWKLVICTYDNTGKHITLYHGSEKVKDASFSGAIRQSTDPIVIGKNIVSNAPFTGSIQAVLAWNRVLSSAEITELSANAGNLSSHFTKLNTLAHDIKQSKTNIFSQLSSKLIPEAHAVTAYNLCTGDTGPGLGGYRTVEVNGCGEVLNYGTIQNSCAAEVDVIYKSPLWNAQKKEWETIKADGKVISQADMIDKASQDPRMGGDVFLSSTSDPPYINCNLFFEYSGRTDCEVVSPKGTQDTNKLAPGETVTMRVKRGSDASQHNTFPDCREQIKTKVFGTTVTPTPTPTPSPSPTPNTPTPSPSPTGSQCTAGTFSSVQMEIATGCGSISSQPVGGATTGTITYTAPNVTSDVVCTMRVNTGNNGDCKLDAAGKGTAANPLKPGESMSVNFTNACVDNAPGCTVPLYISQTATIPTDEAVYKLAESETGLNAAQERGFVNQTFTTTYNLVDQKPGMKQIWVEFTDKRTGEKTKDFLNVELVDKSPVIKQVSCLVDIQKNAVNFTLTGLRFGAEKPVNVPAGVTANGNGLDVTSWSDSSIKASLRNANLSDGDQIYKVKVLREGNNNSPEVECRLGVAQLSLGAKLFCRGEGKFDLADVKLTIIDETGKKAEELTSITAAGLITGLKTKFEIGKRYVISIDAPRVLRRNVSFTAEEGTTVITKDDGSTLLLPISDISPVLTNGDGTINSLDQAELKRQWRNVESTNTATLTADFNRDKRVNAFDWSCMRRDFGSSDDPVPSAPSTNSIGVDFNSGSSSGSDGSISVDFYLPSPNPQVSPISNPTSTPASSVTHQQIIRGIEP
jgi:hypothetical protein